MYSNWVKPLIGFCVHTSIKKKKNSVPDFNSDTQVLSLVLCYETRADSFVIPGVVFQHFNLHLSKAVGSTTGLLANAFLKCLHNCLFYLTFGQSFGRALAVPTICASLGMSLLLGIAFRATRDNLG